MKNLKELVREQFHKLIDEHGKECAIDNKLLDLFISICDEYQKGL